MSDVGLTDRQRQAIDCLTLEGPRGSTARGFAEFAGLTRDSASGALNRLVKMGLVRRETGIGGNPTKFYLVDHDAEEPSQATDAYDKGWMLGYEQGRAAGVKEAEARIPPVKDEYRRGVTDGRILGSRDLGSDVLELVVRMQYEIRSKGSPVYVHSKTCWAIHPACALDGVRKLVERETGIKEAV